MDVCHRLNRSADDCSATEYSSRHPRIHILLPEVDAVGAHLASNLDPIVNDKRHATTWEREHQLFGVRRNSSLVASLSRYCNNVAPPSIAAAAIPESADRGTTEASR